MATQTRTPKLTWDSFLESSLERSLGHKPDAAHIARARLHIDRFRQNDWKAIKLELKERYGFSVTTEPHWVAPGRAVYWHREVSVGREWNDTADGVETVEEVGEWLPSSELPARNASNLATYLQKGFALRPPSAMDAEDAEDDEAAEPSGAQSDHYVCLRHGKGIQKGFAHWTAYLRHCQHYREVPEIDPPADVVEKASHYAYFCFLHDVGWNNAKLAQQHIRGELRKPGRAVHAQLRDMNMAQLAKKD
jgi:hypothetical protein